MPPFIPGLKLSELFFTEAVKPILDKEFPRLRYSVGRIGPGSDVLGFDDKRSTDHDWGARLELFLEDDDYKHRNKIISILSIRLPRKIHGYPTSFSDSDENNVRVPLNTKAAKVSPYIKVYTVKSFFVDYLHWNPSKNPDVYDWLTFPEHRLATVRSGKLFHDGLNIVAIRKTLDYYPHQVWLFLLASQWSRIGQEEAFVGRCGEANDELGSRIIAARLVNDLMRLCSLMEKRYSPYSKWFGTAFNNLKAARRLKPILDDVLDAKTWKDRERALSAAYKAIADMHNRLAITKLMPTRVTQFHDRPYLVIHADAFSQDIRKRITDKKLKAIERPVGSVNQFTTSTDVLEGDTTRLKDLYH